MCQMNFVRMYEQMGELSSHQNGLTAVGKQGGSGWRILEKRAQ